MQGDAPPMKRVRRGSSPIPDGSNGHIQNSGSSSQLPALSLSILGVEPLDEFIKEIADFVHHMIVTCPKDIPNAKVEVEAKIGVLRERSSGRRLALPVVVETSTFPFLLRLNEVYGRLTPLVIQFFHETSQMFVLNRICQWYVPLFV